jgi:para-nitrobenzyl esterase
MSDAPLPLAAGPRVADTAHGAVCGRELDGAIAFLDVPYGAPTGHRRFQAPEPPEPWEGVRDALVARLQAPQIHSDAGPSLFRSWRTQLEDSEDCLRLHVWTPATETGSARPVLVWLHGGGFRSGSAYNAAYDGTRLASRHDVVVVSIGHRLNVFGHLYLRELGSPELTDSGNAGMLDVVLALQWIQDNIAQFGGDPANVTVFGQSGGGGKVTALLAMPHAAGLFHKAIVQSSSTGIGGRSAGSATEDAVAFMAELGLRPSQVSDLLTMPMDRLVAGTQLLTQRKENGARPWAWSGRREWRPVIDGRSYPESAFYPDAPACSAAVPLLVGTTKDECRLHVGASNPAAFDLGWESLPLILRAALDKDPTDTIDFYTAQYPRASASDLLFQIFTFSRWRYSAIWLAERRLAQGGGPVYMYRVDWETPVEGGRWRAPHAVDIPFVFDNVSMSESMVGEGPEAQLLADQMSAAWVAFARTGTPQTAGLPSWPAYSRSERSTLCFNRVPIVVHDPEREERRRWSSEAPRLPL